MSGSWSVLKNRIYRERAVSLTKSVIPPLLSPI